MRCFLQAALLLLSLPPLGCDAGGGTPARVRAEPPRHRPRPTHIARAARSTPQAAPRSAGVDAPTIAVLRAGLSSPDYATRLVATDALGCAPAAVALGALERQLGDPEADVRAAAILSLHKQNDRTARALLRSVRDDDQEELSLRVLAAAALINPPPSCR